MFPGEATPYEWISAHPLVGVLAGLIMVIGLIALVVDTREE